MFIRRTISLLGLLGLGVFTAGAASATPLTLVSGSGSSTNDTPCIFTGSGGGNCMLFAGSGAAPPGTPAGGSSTYSGTSYTYTVSQLIAALGGDNTFNVGIDSNWAGMGQDTLNDFGVFIGGVEQYDYAGPAGPVAQGAPGSLVGGPNGVGMFNFNLVGPVDMSALAGGTEIYFTLEMSGLSDGFEQFFLVGAGFIDPCIQNPQGPDCNGGPVDPPPSVPEPGSLFLLSLGLLGLGAAGRRRRMNG